MTQRCAKRAPYRGEHAEFLRIHQGITLRNKTRDFDELHMDAQDLEQKWPITDGRRRNNGNRTHHTFRLGNQL